MNLKSVFAAVVLVLAPVLAHAGVIYEWRITNNETPWGISLQLEFDQATVDSGAFAFEYYQSHGPNITPLHGLLSFRYTTLAHASSPMTYNAANGGFPSRIGFVSLELQFNPAGFLEGKIGLGDEEQHVEMTSNGVLFTVVDANHDGNLEEAGCEYLGPPCIGAQGLLVRVPDAVNEVAEPISLGLLCAGGIGLIAARRRRAASGLGQATG